MLRMMFLSLGDMMIEMADFEVDVCARAERFVKDQDLDEAITKVLETFDGVDSLRADQEHGIATSIRSKDGFWRFCQRDSGKIVVIRTNSWTLCIKLHNLAPKVRLQLLSAH